ncbi:hypothetical protein AGOR_G00075160 [Albula goreensis]|uniref:Uncharacterized protein n=1 Tax=Albula goreensis TaxID=1534307 RepID=A0A8T3DMK2_9TELE|nr:hypothetical protein AGOR_G00075160 [Albula goreensis]
MHTLSPPNIDSKRIRRSSNECEKRKHLTFSLAFLVLGEARVPQSCLPLLLVVGLVKAPAPSAPLSILGRD